MKILVKFSADIGLSPLEKEVSPNETVENLEVIISLNYEKMSECKLVFNSKPLVDKNQVIRDIMDPNGVNQVTVTHKSELEAYAEQVGSLVQLFQQYPVYAVAGIVGLIFLMLFLMGG